MPRSKPTSKQLAFAEKLGIDVPEDATKGQVSRLIDHALLAKRRAEEGLDHLPNEIGNKVMFGKHLFPSRHRLKKSHEIGQYLRKHMIRVGSVVYLNNHVYGGVYVVMKVVSGGLLMLRHMDRLRTITRYPVGYDNVSEIITLKYNPTFGFVHEVFVFSCKDQLKRRDFVMAHAKPEDQYKNQFGTFLRQSAVTQLCAMYESERCSRDKHIMEKRQKVRAEREKAHKAEQEKRHGERYCNACGNIFKNPTLEHRVRRCPNCIETKNKMARNRYCSYCGKSFVQDQGGATWYLCGSCESK